MTMVVTEPCVGCKHTDYVAVCPCDSFHEGEKMLYIHPDHCIECEACIPECPVEAIYRDTDVPPDFFLFIDLNAQGARSCPVITEKKG
jgi:ferredoxin